jgi:hypothetical protein
LVKGAAGERTVVKIYRRGERGGFHAVYGDVCVCVGVVGVWVGVGGVEGVEA